MMKIQIATFSCKRFNQVNLQRLTILMLLPRSRQSDNLIILICVKDKLHMF